MSTILANSILSKLSAWYTMDGHLSDSHAGRHLISTHATPTYDASGKSNSFLLPGTRANYTLVPGASITPTTGKFTIGGWVNFGTAVASAAEFGFTSSLNGGQSEVLYIKADVDSRVSAMTWIASGVHDLVKPTSGIRYVTYNVKVQVRDALDTIGEANKTLKVAATGGATPGWVFVVATWDAGTMSIYIDGELAASKVITALKENTISHFQVGHNGYYGNTSGQDELFFSTNSAMTADEIAYIYNLGVGRNYQSVVDDSSGFSVTPTPTVTPTITVTRSPTPTPTVTPTDTPYPSPTPSFAPTSAFSLLKFEGSNGSTTVSDDTGKLWTLFGTSAISNAEHVVGATSLRAASGSRLESDSTYNLNASDFTIQACIRLDSLGSPQMIVAQDYGNGDNNNFQFRVNTSGQLEFVGWSSSARASAWTVTSSGTIAANKWTHVAVCRSGNNIKLFINGVKTADNSSNVMWAGASSKIGIGNFHGGAWTSTLVGYIDQVQIDQTALYTTDFVAPTTILAGVEEWWSFNDALTGNKGVRNFSSGTVAYAASSLGGKYLDPSSLVESTVGASAALETTNFTFGGRVRVSGTSDFGIMCQRDSNGGSYEIVNFYWQYATSTLNASVKNNAGTTVNVPAPGALPANTWANIAVTYDGTTIRLYVNGTQAASAAQSGIPKTGAYRMNLGFAYNATYNADFDEVFTANRALTAAEMSYLHSGDGKTWAMLNA